MPRPSPMEVEAGMTKGHQQWKAEAEFHSGKDKEFPLQQLLELVVEIPVAIL